MTIKPKITELLKRLNDGVFEKEDVIALTLLSAVAGESIFLLGAPGVAKSLIARRLKYAFKNGSSFEYLMNRFSTPDEIFGPVSIKQLRDEDKYQRVVENYLPTATVVFLDEIWKAGPSIQNALLTILNEKIYRNGDLIIDPVPMKALISASNELPSKGEGLEALWDRFLVRIVVEGVQDKQNFNDMISKSLNSYSDTVTEILKISNEEYDKWSKDIDNIEIPVNVFNVIHIIRKYIDQHNNREENIEKQIYISDRRWRKTVRLVRTSAFLNDRNAVDLMDCFLIKDCLWNETEQIQTVSQFVKDAIKKHGYLLTLNLTDIKEELSEFWHEVKDETSHMKPIKTIKKHHNDYYSIEGFDYPLVKITDYDALGDDYKNITFYYKPNDRYSYKNDSIKLSNKPNHIVHDGQLKKMVVEDFEKLATKRPHPAVKKDWDKRVKVVLTTTSNLKSQIEHFKSNDLKHIRVNLFVNQMFADIVEENLFQIGKEIEKLELEVNRIQHYYENVENDVLIEGTIQGLLQNTAFDLRELSEELDEWIFDELENYDIITSNDFLAKDLNYYEENTQIDEDTFNDLKNAIDTKLRNG
ncbi:AAA family ATPase [Flavobacterium psychrotolerans]|uniref:ATPase n=1 Tax=Flavobacterium psychrotolerans TaxID=2169410 RepID=A0A2U1JHX7_9FLAO|nr:AAA family ATPase [Flavobacterium psychrotolerans]PWA04599.1 ATPase [Flavobacterium psychrotolerans]